ncbi:MAG: glycosyltransferase family 2 protein [Caldimonas sp.]
MTTARRVSIVVPCRNERDHIAAFAASALAQVLPPGWTLELVVADGMSDDGTREALAEVAAEDPRVSFVDNPGRIVSSGLNHALAATSGEVVVRMDVHTEYAPDYVAECLAALEASGADNVGGAWRAEADPAGGPMQAAIAAAFQSRWVAGGALSRRLDYDGPVDTVYLGAWPRRSFDRYGLFDETLVRNQDDEHNLRIVRAGGRLWQSSRIHSRYRPRATLGQVFRQYLQYGYWKPFVMKKHGQPARLRHLAPAALVIAVGGAALAALLGLGAGPLVLWLVGYALAVAALTAATLAATPQRRAVALRIPAVIVAYHVAYGLGSIAGAWDVLRQRPGRERFSGLTR